MARLCRSIMSTPNVLAYANRWFQSVHYDMLTHFVLLALAPDHGSFTYGFLTMFVVDWIQFEPVSIGPNAVYSTLVIPCGETVLKALVRIIKWNGCPCSRRRGGDGCAYAGTISSCIEYLVFIDRKRPVSRCMNDLTMSLFVHSLDLLDPTPLYIEKILVLIHHHICDNFSSSDRTHLYGW
jgi:hypothetical protein